MRTLVKAPCAPRRTQTVTGVEGAQVSPTANRFGRLSIASLLGMIALASLFAVLSPAGARAATNYSHTGQFGGPGSGNGVFSKNPAPQRIAVHEASGKLFVADRGNNRVQVFSPTAGGAQYAFEIPTPAPVSVAVDQTSGDLYVSNGAVTAVNEVQRVRFENISSGTYTLSFEGEATAPIPFDASAATVQSALEGVASVGAGSVNVADEFASPPLVQYRITFVNGLAGKDVGTLTIDATELNSEAIGTVNVVTSGRQAEAEGIRKYNPDSSTDPTAYARDLGFTSPTPGFGSGQFGALQGSTPRLPSPGGMAVDPTTGNLLVADVGHQVIQRYSPTGSFIGSITGCGETEPLPGWCFSTTRPRFSGIRDFAVNSQGHVIVAEVSGNQARVDRFLANGTYAATLSKENNPVPNTQLASFQNSGIAVAVHPDTDEVFVSSVTGNNFVPQPTRIFQFENDVLVADFGGAGNFSGYVQGMAATAASKLLYVLAADNPGEILDSSFYVQVFKAITPPGLVLNPAADITTAGARLTGTVDPNEEEVVWRFRYRQVGSPTWISVPVPDGNAGSGPDPVPVEATIGGLEPNTEYEFVLSANAGTLSVETPPQTFKTLVAPPVVDTAKASFLDVDAATLVGGVNPRNTATDYFFEWGESDSYGNVAPATPASAGAGGERVPVSARIDGLEPNATYHFRLVAENSSGQTDEGDDASFTTLAEPLGGLQGKRGYELATQQPAGVQITAQNSAASEHGNSLAYRFSETDPHPPGVDKPHKWVLMERGDSGWTGRFADLPNPADLGFGRPVHLSEDMKAVFAESTVGLDPDDRNGVLDLYLNRPGQDPVWITRAETVPPGEPQTDTARAGFVNGTPTAAVIADDGSTIVFASSRRLIESDNNPSHPDQTPQSPGGRLYKWKDGELTLISERPDGSQPTGSSVRPGGPLPIPLSAIWNANSPNAVSADGSRVFWGDGTTLFVHIEGEGSRAIGPGSYVDATPDGERMFYTSGGRMFAYDVDGDETHDLTGAAELRGPVAVAETGDRVYYVAKAALTAEPSPLGRLPVAGAPNLYVTELDDGGEPVRTRLVAVLGDFGEAEAHTWDPIMTARAATASPDGTILAFGSLASLTGQPTAGVRQLFVYDDDTGSLTCPSCPADGSTPVARPVNHNLTTGGHDQGGDFNEFGWQSLVTAKRLVSTDGTVFFDTATPLVGADENLERDVYELRNGQLRMLTSGRAKEDASIVVGASKDGSTVFVASPTKFDPRDIETGYRKIWAVRVGGGFEYQGPQPGCTGDGCEGEVSPPPALAPMGSLGLQGAGNLSEPGAAPSVKVAKAGAPKGGKGAVRVSVPAAGTITVSGPGVVKRTKKVAKAGSYRVGVSLSGSAARALASKGGFTANVRVTFRPRSGKATSRSVNLRFKAGKAAKGGRR